LDVAACAAARASPRASRACDPHLQLRDEVAAVARRGANHADDCDEHDCDHAVKTVEARARRARAAALARPGAGERLLIAGAD
jgi:hypothetical protein